MPFEGTAAVVTGGASGLGLAITEAIPLVPGHLVQLGADLVLRCEGDLARGLSLVRSVTEAHHGTVLAGPRPEGPGARFCVRLPG